MSMYKDLLLSIQNEKLEHAFQPLWYLENWELFGYEALLRLPHGIYHENIEKIFEIARNEGFLYELDTQSMRKVISSFPFQLFNNELLFINLFPSTLLHEQFELFMTQLIERYPQIVGRIVIELNETVQEARFWENPLLKERISFLRDLQFFIALDDIGKGVATFEKIDEYKPTYIKLDRQFSNGLSNSIEKQQMISLLLEYLKQGTVLILEGIERDVDLAQAKLLHVPVAQGYLLGKPEKLFHYNFLKNTRS